MADYSIICVLCAFIHVVYGTSYIKGLYCQDPDTKKLYPINTTWKSETFCGNYTCKMRKKNLTETEYTPITKINITAQHLKENNKHDVIVSHDDMSTSPSEQSFVIQKFEPEKQPVFHKDVHNKINEFNNGLKNNKSEDKDRYLTESEIKTITEILHTIKKSDLEAIIEIYNIAQEIYNEIGSPKADKFVKDTINSIKNDETEVKKKPLNDGKNSISYWYEPLRQYHVKPKPVDLKTDGTNVMPTVHPYSYPVTYFNGPLQDKDFGKLPYYYPTSSFHRKSSYVHNPHSSQQNRPQEAKPCKKQKPSPIAYIPPAWYKAVPNENMESYKRSTIAQPMLLPYPFSYVHHYNYTYPASYYYNNYPWAQLDTYNRNKYYPQPYYGTYGAQEPKTAIIANADELEGKQKSYASKEDKNEELAEWQTEPLSEKVLEEVRANVLEKSKLLKPLSLRKNMKLEKVGKVIKLDELTRSKRDISAEDGTRDRRTSGDSAEGEEYETYIEKTTKGWLEKVDKLATKTLECRPFV
ncbi:unnamed protein product [Euphydryas editha]|uniref:Uncharacterized protein n=1 Tax=Euphydryas editha TaxID=104508 RepID=A0AAU9UFI2_EUPED|nr:unnamed protein product [Euphydryas editha]